MTSDTTMPKLILASTSRFRRAMLDRLGLPYTACPPPFEEIAPEGLSPPKIASLFAQGKAQSITTETNAWIIGSDQVLEIDGRILHKTTDLDDCRKQLAELSGKTHALHASVALWVPKEQRLLEETVTVTMTMRVLDPAVIDRYVILDEPTGSAGGYLFEGRGIGLFENVQGGDDSAIIGLPLLSLCRLLRKAGLEPFSFPS